MKVRNLTTLVWDFPRGFMPETNIKVKGLGAYRLYRLCIGFLGHQQVKIETSFPIDDSITRGDEEMRLDYTLRKALGKSTQYVSKTQTPLDVINIGNAQFSDVVFNLAEKIFREFGIKVDKKLLTGFREEHTCEVWVRGKWVSYGHYLRLTHKLPSLPSIGGLLF